MSRLDDYLTGGGNPGPYTVPVCPCGAQLPDDVAGDLCTNCEAKAEAVVIPTGPNRAVTSHRTPTSDDDDGAGLVMGLALVVGALAIAGGAYARLDATRPTAPSQVTAPLVSDYQSPCELDPSRCGEGQAVIIPAVTSLPAALAAAVKEHR